jgi:hypothetical protein
MLKHELLYGLQLSSDKIFFIIFFYAVLTGLGLPAAGVWLFLNSMGFLTAGLTSDLFVRKKQKRQFHDTLLQTLKLGLLLNALSTPTALNLMLYSFFTPILSIPTWTLCKDRIKKANYFQLNKNVTYLAPLAGGLLIAGGYVHYFAAAAVSFLLINLVYTIFGKTSRDISESLILTDTADYKKLYRSVRLNGRLSKQLLELFFTGILSGIYIVYFLEITLETGTLPYGIALGLTIAAVELGNLLSPRYVYLHRQIKTFIMHHARWLIGILVLLGALASNAFLLLFILALVSALSYIDTIKIIQTLPPLLTPHTRTYFTFFIQLFGRFAVGAGSLLFCLGGSYLKPSLLFWLAGLFYLLIYYSFSTGEPAKNK